MGGVLVLTLMIPLVGLASGSGPESIELQSIIDAAPPGSHVTLSPGTYQGGVTIDKPLTIEGHGAIIDGGGTGSVITVTAHDVTLRHLVIRNSGISPDREDSAVSADGADRLTIEDCKFDDVLFGAFLRLSPDAIIRDTTIGSKDLEPGRRGDAIRLWESPGTLIAGNTIEGGRDSVAFYSEGIVVRDNVFRNGRYGLHFMYASDALVERNLFEGNSVGAFVMYSDGVSFLDNVVIGSFGPSGYGLGLKDADGTAASGNRFLGNRVGIYFDNSPMRGDSSQVFAGNLFANNDIGLLFTASVERNRFTANAFIANGEQVAVSGAGILDGNDWTVDGIGNHWDDYRGFDGDGDGVGDIAYRLDDLYSSMMARHPELALFSGTPAARAVDLTGRMFPSLEPVALVVDTAPLTRRPAMAPPALGALDTGSGALLLASLGLLAFGVIIVLTSYRRVIL